MTKIYYPNLIYHVVQKLSHSNFKINTQFDDNNDDNLKKIMKLKIVKKMKKIKINLFI